MEISAHARIQEFLSGGVQARRPENSLDNGFFFVCFFCSPQLILQFTEGGPMVLLQRKIYFSKHPEGFNIFQGGGGGGPTYTRGV